MLQFEGEKTLSQAPIDCWTNLTNPRFLSRCIPDIQVVNEPGPDQVRFKLRPGVAFIRGTLEVTIKVERLETERSARYLVHSRSIGSSSDAEATLKFKPENNGTLIKWSVVIKSLGGLLKAVPQGLIQASAQKVLTDIWSAVDNQMTKMQ